MEVIDEEIKARILGGASLKVRMAGGIRKPCARARGAPDVFREVLSCERSKACPKGDADVESIFLAR